MEKHHHSPITTGPQRFGSQQAQKFYDNFGARQDKQGFYEDKALDTLIAAGNFATARTIFEFGCGTGRLARRLLQQELPRDAVYLGVDLSSTMVSLARERVAAFGSRANILKTEGDEEQLPAENGWADRVVSSYVFDLLPEEAVITRLADLHRILQREGLLCHSGITPGHGAGKIVSAVWSLLHKINPAWVGGCRPVVLADFLDGDHWDILVHKQVTAWGITSEVLVASRR